MQIPSHIRHHIKCLHILKRKYNKCSTDSNKVKFGESENLLQAKISQDSKFNYEANLVSTYANNNNSKFYGYIKNITKSDSLPSKHFITLSLLTLILQKLMHFTIIFILYSIKIQDTIHTQSIQNLIYQLTIQDKYI